MRSIFEYVVSDRAGNVIQNAKVLLREYGTSTPALGAWDAPTGGQAVTELTSDANGYIRCWWVTPKLFDLIITDNGNAAYYPWRPTPPLDFPDSAPLTRGNPLAHRPLIQIITTTGGGTWPLPEWATMVRVQVRGAGGGGGSGRKGAPGTVRCGGGGGGAGAISESWISAATLRALWPTGDIPYFVGTGGPGGAAVITDDTNGNNGGGPMTSVFGGTTQSNGLVAVHGAVVGGSGGTVNSGTGGGGGLGEFPPVPGSGASATGGNGLNGPAVQSRNPSGGGGGGGVNAANAFGTGGHGGVCGTRRTSNFVVFGGATEGAPGDTPPPLGDGWIPGHGGAGGAGSATGNGGKGGDGVHGSGGGGGGAATNGVGNSGAGGRGGDGCIIVEAW